MIHFIHRCQLPVLLAWSTSPQMVSKLPWKLQSMNPLHSLPIHQFSSSVLLFIQLRSHDSSLIRTLPLPLCAFITSLWQKVNSEWTQLPFCSKAEHKLMSLNKKVPHQGRSISPCILDNYSLMPFHSAQQHAPFLSSTLQHASGLICPPQTSDSSIAFLTLGLQPCLLFLREHWVCYMELSQPHTAKCSSPPPPSCSLAFSPSYHPRLVHPHALRSMSPALSGNAHFSWSLLSPAPSLMDFSPGYLHTHKFVVVVVCLFVFSI